MSSISAYLQTQRFFWKYKLEFYGSEGKGHFICILAGHNMAVARLHMFFCFTRLLHFSTTKRDYLLTTITIGANSVVLICCILTWLVWHKLYRQVPAQPTSIHHPVTTQGIGISLSAILRRKRKMRNPKAMKPWTSCYSKYMGMAVMKWERLWTNLL